MIEETNLQIDEPNRWRLDTPGASGWKRTARPDDPHRYVMVSADCHFNEPSGLWQKMPEEYRKRLPQIEVDENGVKWMASEGLQRSRRPTALQGEDDLRNKSGYIMVDRQKDHARDGIDAEIIFPNKGSVDVGDADAEFGAAQCRVWNDWAWETYGPYNDFMSPMAAIMTADVELAMPRSSGSPSWAIADSPCHASRFRDSRRAPSELQPARCTIRCGRRFRITTCRSRSTSRPDATLARRARTAARSSTMSRIRSRRR